MRKWEPQPGDPVQWEAFSYGQNPLYPRNGTGKIIRKLNPEVETFPYEVEVELPDSHKGQRFCFRASELYLDA